MGLDVDAPMPPELEFVDPNEYEDASVAADADYRREELEEFQIAGEMGLFEQFDFFWDDFADRVGYHAPGIPEDWKERALHPEIDSWKTVSSINAGLTELGQTACEVLKDDYITWESEYEAPDDLPDF